MRLKDISGTGCVSCVLLLLQFMSAAAFAQSDYPVLTIPHYPAPPVYGVPQYQVAPTYPVAPAYPGVIQTYPIDRTTRRAPTAATPGAGDFSVTLRTDFLSAFINRDSVESNNVTTRVLEADVRGVQTTATAVRLESVDSIDKARLHILATGTVSSNTVGYTPQAQIATTGNHTFNVIKPVFFDGERFLTKSAYGRLHVQQSPQAVSTVASGLPLIGRIGERVAWNQVYRRMPVTDAIVAQRVADDVLPRVNSAVDKELAELNLNWKSLRRKVDEIVGRGRLKWSSSSTSNSFSATALNTAITQRSLDPNAQLIGQLTGPEVVALVYSQDGINEFIRRLPLAGQTFSDAALQRLVLAIQGAQGDYSTIRKALSDVLYNEAEPTIFAIEFSSKRPLEIQLEDGALTIDLRFRVIPRIGNASQMEFLRVRVGGESSEEGTWSIAVRDITCEPADPSQDPDIWATTINTQAQNVLSRIPVTDLPRRIDLRHVNPRMPVLRIHRIQTQNAQLRFSLKRESPGMEVVSGRPNVEQSVRKFSGSP